MSDATVTETLFEPVNTAAAVEDFLFAGIKGMAPRANVDEDILTKRRLSFDHISTAAGCFDGTVTWVNICVHGFCLVICGVETHILYFSAPHLLSQALQSSVGGAV